ncbi:MAG: hypothetical protein JWO75_6655, partial [Actinomycetia bacterium]|nr:hypothetical protein [Actinomycetes bacterium]
MTGPLEPFRLRASRMTSARSATCLAESGRS